MTKDRDIPHHQLGNVVYHITARTTPGFELDGESRKLVLDAVRHFDKSRYTLHACVIMPDHMHILIQPLKDENGDYHILGNIMHSLKSYTAHAINDTLKRSGAVWQRNYLDRSIRGRRDYEEVWNYILQNPVKAGLVRRWSDYPYVWCRTLRDPSESKYDNCASENPTASLDE